MLSITDIEDKLLRPMTAQIIFLLVAAMLGYELISGVTTYYRVHSDLKIATVHSGVHHTSVKTQSAMQKTLRVPVFGEYIPKALVDLDVKPSGLDLSLVGIVFSSTSKESQVIINSPGNPTQTFSTGDLVPGGAKIKQITPDGVVLEHDGELESLSLPKNELIFEPVPEPLKHNIE